VREQEGGSKLWEQMERAWVEGAGLEGARVEVARVEGASVDGARVDGARWRDCVYRKARGLQKTYFYLNVFVAISLNLFDHLFSLGL
jgi:hypothetical protein